MKLTDNLTLTAERACTAMKVTPLITGLSVILPLPSKDMLGGPVFAITNNSRVRSMAVCSATGDWFATMAPRARTDIYLRVSRHDEHVMQWLACSSHLPDRLSPIFRDATIPAAL